MLLELSPSYFPHFHVRSPKLFPIRSPCRCSVSLPSKGAALKLLPTVSCPFTLSLRLSRSLSRELSPSYFRPCPVRSPCVASASQAISDDFLYRRCPVRSPCCGFGLAPAPELSPSYLSRVPVWSPSCWSSPQATSNGFMLVPSAISHGFPSVHRVGTSVSLVSWQSKLNENLSIGDAFGKKARCVPSCFWVL